VTEYLDGSGAVQSHYEYDPFGNDITPAGTAGSLHNSFPFRFSTKYLDPESGQYEYGMREYNQLIGRWNSRDPIEEDGGLNLYGICSNDLFDCFGEYGKDVHGYFTYFAALATGASVNDGRQVAYYAWGPDAASSLNAINAFFANTNNVFKVQRELHALTGGKAEEFRVEMLKRLPRIKSNTRELGFFTHTYQDSYAHTVLKRFFWNSILNMFRKNKKPFSSTGSLYSTGFGHAFHGTTPDQVSARPAMFTDMAQRLYSDVFSGAFGSRRMDLGKYSKYVNAIAAVPDNDREDFIKFVIDCSARTAKPSFEGLLKQFGIKRLSWDNDVDSFRLPGNGEFEDERALDFNMTRILIQNAQ